MNKNIPIRFLMSIVMLSIFLKGQSYEVGNQLTPEHLASDLTICANDSGLISLDLYNGAANGEDYHVIWLNFFASWCSTCLAEIPYATQIYNQYKDQGLVVLSFGRQWDNPYSCLDWAELGAEYNILDDDSTQVWSWFGLGTVPQSVILDHNMIVRYNSYGFNESETVSVIESFLAEMPSVNVNDEIVPVSFKVTPPYPNPFNAKISWTVLLGKELYLETIVFDITGKEVQKITNEHYSEGSYFFSWDASVVPSGVYLLKLITPFHNQTHKMILLK
ncbi:MAG: redoxin domain-containing protein [Candidatus Marinimicrobia bacterium]|jgi:thiol-disulfide isomerase/thioredoxin|nr:redoxin domain-containing protein [Candidatus Neomarinimicrobiota bacterium]MBT3829561.1 redoxin domain-containing protein [Candidatus Neomarinimicrobiota bacterium]MBT3997444.1 redoxin domain-containing protein [Candidatus Neomarinimicrobiota bacterium]MBT4569208.1 redoxin domain-containing protein [Candidatus Neomarinimicrobiota bacterium]MBT4796053.1 redoxin domain-containing protein [Candidatus Neomarinimicrobiota bacterium]